MPLSSRATQNRAERSADTTTATPPGEATQPRQKRGQPTPPAEQPAATQPVVNGDQDGIGGAAATTAAKRPRKARVAAEKPVLDANAAPKDLKARQRAIEKEFKTLNRELMQAQREVTQKFKERRQALESEHRLISSKLSGMVFNG